jgi:hypothetical protein
VEYSERFRLRIATTRRSGVAALLGGRRSRDLGRCLLGGVTAGRGS